MCREDENVSTGEMSGVELLQMAVEAYAREYGSSDAGLERMGFDILSQCDKRGSKPGHYYSQGWIGYMNYLKRISG